MKQDFSNGTSSVVYGEVEQKNFGIALGSKIFLILSDKLYADKILAPIRELICNARDAHIEAGTADKRFIVHLPTTSEPYFSVRDFGTGLTHEEVINLYTVYGMTTKDDTNKAIGCWGLGSKSPFAYTDRFEVYSYKDGVLNVYQCLMSDGAPTVTKFDTCKTSEPNGLEVKFDVKRGDFSSFSERLNKMIFMQDYMEVKGAVPYSFPCIPKRSGRFYDFVEGSYYGSSIEDGLSVEMGGVIYRVSRAMGRANNLDTLMCRVNYPKLVVIHAELGDVDITTSREQLDMTDKTYAFLDKAAKEFMDSILDKVKEEIKKEKGILRKLLRWRQLKSVYGSFAYIWRYSNLYDKLSVRVREIASIGTVEAKGSKCTQKNYFVAAVNAFTSEVSDILDGKYPTFVDCSDKLVLPPEIRAAVSALGKTLHCVRDKKTLGYLVRFGIPVHSLDEYKKYRPARIYTPASKRKKATRADGELVVGGLSTKEFAWTLTDVKERYKRGGCLYWSTQEEFEEARLSAAAIIKAAPNGLASWSSLCPSIGELLRSIWGGSVTVTTKAAEERAKNDPKFIHLPTELKKFLRSKAQIKEAINSLIAGSVSKYLKKYRSYGRGLDEFFYKEVVSQLGNNQLFILPYIKKFLLSTEELSQPSVGEIQHRVVASVFDYSVNSLVSSIDGSLKRYIGSELPLLHAFMRYIGDDAIYFDGYSQKEKEDIEEYLNWSVKRLRKAEKEKQNNNIKTNEKEN